LDKQRFDVLPVSGGGCANADTNDMSIVSVLFPMDYRFRYPRAMFQALRASCAMIRDTNSITQYRTRLLTCHRLVQAPSDVLLWSIWRIPVVIQASQFEGHVRNARTWPSISKQSAKIRWSKRSPKLECRGTTELDIGSDDWDFGRR
jgi:hypothetical protein